MRRKIYRIIEPATDKNSWSFFYDVLMMLVIVLSVIPLAFKGHNVIFDRIDKVVVVVFIIDYVLRLLTADFALPRKGWIAFFLYPLTPLAIVDLLSILPILTVLNSAFRLLKLLRLLRTLRVLRVFKPFRYSKTVTKISNVLRKQRTALLAVGTMAIAYILLSALVVFNVEPESFDSFFDAVYWSTISLTTVGYGDIYPITPIGQVVTMVSSILGIAIVALPAGIITAGYMRELEKDK